MTEPTRTKKPRSPKKRRIVRVAVAVAAASSGLLCQLLPAHYQTPCSLAAKLVAFFVGGE